MCSRYETPEAAEMAKAFKISQKITGFKTLAYPGYDEPIVRDTGDGLLLELRFWGNIFKRAHKTQKGKFAWPNYQNAKFETLERIYRKEWQKNQRCLIPVKRF